MGLFSKLFPTKIPSKLSKVNDITIKSDVNYKDDPPYPNNPYKGQNGTTLSETVTTGAIWGNNYNWTISKTASPKVLNLATSPSGDVNYTITLTNDAGSFVSIIKGKVCIKNGGAEATENLKCNLELRLPPLKDIILSVPLDLKTYTILQPGEEHFYDYELSITPLAPQTTFKITANTTITNHSGHLNKPFGPNESASSTFPSAATTTNDHIRVIDTNLPPLDIRHLDAVIGGGTQYISYDVTYTCAKEGENTNTATIIETGQSASTSITVICGDTDVTTLSQTVTTDALWGTKYNWTIFKSATPTVLNLVNSPSGVVSYAVSLENDAGETEASLFGKVCIKNKGTVATVGLQCILQLTLPPSTDIIEIFTLNLGSNTTIGAGETNCYDYEFPITPLDEGRVYMLTANTTILNYLDHPGEEFGIKDNAINTFPDAEENINDIIRVSDPNLPTTTITATAGGGTQYLYYDVTYTCKNEGENTNTATIIETSQSSSTTIKVFCERLSVSKTVNLAYTRTYNWSIVKKGVHPKTNAEITTLRIPAETQYTIKYNVTVTPVIVDSDFIVSGVITVKNNSSTKPANVAISDKLISIIGIIDIDTTPKTATILPSETATFNYSTTLGRFTSASNKAIVALDDGEGNITYFYSELVPVDINSATITEVNPCVNVVDSFKGPLNTTPICKVATTLSYDRVVGPYPLCCGASPIENTAKFTSDTTSGSSSWTINVDVYDSYLAWLCKFNCK